ncbi:Integrase zinc binding domain [Popillia japonica]|uniref:Integrase zinc binding domain n=1 Tax=Popillia japonica TaxID=7064 RepID=A0AAW1N496_POPJA
MTYTTRQTILAAARKKLPGLKDEDFKDHLANWFRHANQRLSRDNGPLQLDLEQFWYRNRMMTNFIPSSISVREQLRSKDYDYKLEHRNGKNMLHADALSRQILILNDNTMEKNLALKQDLLFVVPSSMQAQVINLYHDNMVVPSSMQAQVINLYHDNMGHLGINKTVDLIMKTLVPKFSGYHKELY